MIQQSIKFITYIASLIFPNICFSCKQEIVQDLLLCNNCLSDINPIISSILSINKNINIRVYGIGKYTGILQKLILRKNYHDITTSRHLGLLAGRFLLNKHMLNTIDLLVPIPLHWTRYAYRGYNQSYEISKGIESITGIQTYNLLTRTKKTKCQTTCNKLERYENLKSAFTITHTNVKKNSHILLIDDVMTSGATLQEASKTLIKAGYQVTILVIARA